MFYRAAAVNSGWLYTGMDHTAGSGDPLAGMIVSSDFSKQELKFTFLCLSWQALLIAKQGQSRRVQKLSQCSWCVRISHLFLWVRWNAGRYLWISALWRIFIHLGDDDHIVWILHTLFDLVSLHLCHVSSSAMSHISPSKKLMPHTGCKVTEKAPCCKVLWYHHMMIAVTDLAFSFTFYSKLGLEPSSQKGSSSCNGILIHLTLGMVLYLVPVDNTLLKDNKNILINYPSCCAMLNHSHDIIWKPNLASIFIFY
jgi:hypothetical protein